MTAFHHQKLEQHRQDLLQHRQIFFDQLLLQVDRVRGNHRFLAVADRELNRGNEIRQTFADTTKLRNHFGWQAKVGLDEGLNRQWDWQMGNKS